MKHIQLLSVIFFVFVFSVKGNYTPSDVPDPKKNDANAFVADPSGYISASAITSINAMCGNMKAQTGVEFAIVVLPSIHYNYDPYDFGVELFTEWGIGEKGKDNGLLLLIVMDTRDWRFVSGYGIEGLLTDALLKRMGENHIVPYFKEELYDDGLLAVVSEIEKIVTSDDALYLVKYQMAYEPWWQTWIIWMWILWGILFLSGFVSFIKKMNYQPPKKAKLYSVSNVSASHAIIMPEGKQRVDIWGGNKTLKFISIYMMSAVVPAMSMYFDDFFSNPAKNSFIGLYGFLLVLSIIMQWKINQNVNSIANDNIEKFFTLRTANNALGARVFFFPLPFLLYYIGYRFQLRSLKNGAVTCPICSTKASPMAFESAKGLLSEKKVFEQKIKSIDHKVFQCLNLHTVEVPFPGSRNFKVCTSCGTKAVRQTKDRTVKSATYYSTGTGEKEFTCKFCKHKTYSTYVIPVRTKSSSSSGGSSSGGGGGSWGGGRTGGGGAGGKW